MANPAADPKAAPLADDLKELALSLSTTVFPKAFFCALCSQLAIDSFKLLCCNKAICTQCQDKLEFPTTCPSCDHSPLEADSCTPNKSLRNTMRIWLQKQKKKEDAKAIRAATPPVETAPVIPEAQPAGEAADKPVESVEETPKLEQVQADEATAAANDAEEVVQRAGSADVQPNENSTSVKGEDLERHGSVASQNATKTAEPSTDDPTNEQNTPNEQGMMGNNNPMMNMNGMQGQTGFGFPNQGNFNGMGWNGMNQMNGMTNMMGNGGYGMNPMDFNMNGMSNGMYGNYGGNMGMGMNDMSAMNMMNYGGGYGNGWNGMGGGYGNSNGFNQMGGYNQSGAYPEMMNQFPKNNFPNQNQNQNRFHANQGGAFPQRNRNGSRGDFGPGANGRPGSRSGPAHNVRRFHNLPPRPALLVGELPTSPNSATDKFVFQQRDGQSPDGSAKAAPETKVEDEQTKAPAESTEEGKESNDAALDSINPSGDGSRDADGATNHAGNESNETTNPDGLNKIQTVDSIEGDMQSFDPSMMGDGMQPNMPYGQGMMNQFPVQAPFNPNMNMGMDAEYHHHNNNYGPRGGFNAAYGAATVLIGQPTGVGVEGAPTGPRAMREGRPNTGFSSRVNSARFIAPLKSVTPAREGVPASPVRRVRSRSPERDEALRTKERSPSRARSEAKSRAGDGQRDERRERSRSADRESRRDDRGRSPTPKAEEDYERRKDRRTHRSSRRDDRDEDYDDRHRDDRDSRGDRTRSASADSKYRSSRRDKEKHRSSRSHRDRSREHRRRHRSRSPEDKRDDDDAYANGDKESEGSSRRKHRSDKDRSDKDRSDKERHRERSRDRERDRDRRDRKEKERDRDYEYEKDRSRDKDKERKRRRDRDAEPEVSDHDQDRSSRRSRKDREHRHDERAPKQLDKEEDVVGQMMKKRAVSPPLNAPKGPSANGFSIKGRSKATVMPPPQPPTGPRALQPPKGPRSDKERRRESVGSAASGNATPTVQDHYAAEREKNARERNNKERGGERGEREQSKPRTHASRPSLSSKRPIEDVGDERGELRNEALASTSTSSRKDTKTPTAPAGHRDKRRKSGAGGEETNSIANLFTAGLRKNAKARRGGVRTEGDVEREMERLERERR
ncbi:hypothetical protein P153DRAFT_399556 [Dothidotthia symphoricarpi CBS 119687]|uniref:RING-type domain-containing protein n=1 Tax=Dothidotthia symphoricarpi CBS 119687 TaxID=1392245 RepID=A0A6A6A4P3_9PLEO|nr:uncharacterized protein P153DRAFT_399556 [Dothidotthia symphoricarpi CBS 119687]KAF2126094.1 hypothetical protein P153DRAFT_399556 [Dothidotthia symphoricarpi CBS 119687]